MRKEIILIDDCCEKRGVETVEYFGDDLDAALRAAKYRWDCLTKKEKNSRTNYYVATATVVVDKETGEKYYDEIVKVHETYR